MNNTPERIPCSLYIFQQQAFRWSATLHLSAAQLRDVVNGKPYRDGGFHISYDTATLLYATCCPEDETVLLLLCRDLERKRSHQYKLKIG